MLYQFPLLALPLIPAGLGPGPQVVVASVSHQNPAQAFDREPAAETVDEREPLMCGSLLDQRFRSLMQNFVLHP